MADEPKGVTDLHKEGLIRDENMNIRRDSGQEAIERYQEASAYEKDKIEARAIVYFLVGMVIVVGVSFVLMWMLQKAMEQQTEATDVASPMAMSEQENLPPEPRLQAAPGFGVTKENGERVDLKLREPQAEYRTLRHEWEMVWENGRKDPKTGTVIMLPIEEAKKKVLEQGLGKVRQADAATKASQEARQIPMYSSAGRTVETRRIAPIAESSNHYSNAETKSEAHH